MKHLNKIILLAAAMFSVWSCEKKETGLLEEDKISISPESKEIDSNGGTVNVIVESSTDWTLSSENEYDWVKASSASGKDGDVVKFTVLPNETGKDLSAEYIFTAGKAETTLSLLCRKAEEKPADDKISLFPESIEAEYDGGTFKVLVTSSQDWTLSSENEYDWVTASPVSGATGDEVTFNISENAGEGEKNAIFQFTSGDKTVDFSVSQKGISFSIELISESDITVPTDGGELKVLLDIDFDRSLLGQKITQDGEWMRFVTSLDENGHTSMIFNVDKNTNHESRSAVINITGPGNTGVAVNVTQAQLDFISVGEDIYYVALDGGQIEIPVEANVDYTVTSDDWIQHTGTSEGKELFSVSASSSERSGTISFKGGNAELSVSVQQKRQALVESVANMDGNYARPGWTDASPFENMSTFTMEAYVNIQDFKSTTSITTIMGIEGKFLIRLGDGENITNSTLMVATADGNIYGDYSSIPPFAYRGKWLHIAATFDNGKVQLFLNGTSVASKTISSKTIDLSANTPYGNDSARERFFFVGYSVAEARTLKGYLSEVRIWNKVLSASDFKAENHELYVDPASEGLVAYWKFNDAAGSMTVKDYSKYGNDMTLNNPLETVKVSLP